MLEYESRIKAHYRRDNLGERLLAALEQAGKNLEALTIEDTAPLDQFHIGGKAATLELAALARLQPGERLLDIGCGIGGPARILAAVFGCTVMGIDLVESYCRAGNMLTRKLGLEEHVVLHCGNVLALPFAAKQFEVVWSQHVNMNIAEKERLLSEVRRVLRPGGRFAFHEVCAGRLGPPYFPVPWAADASMSFLRSPAAFRELAAAAGFREILWQDVSVQSLAWFHKTHTLTTPRPAAAQPGPGLLMGETSADKRHNVIRNLEENRIRVIRAVLVASNRAGN